MKLLGLAGHAGAGKDHTFEYLKELLAPRHVERVAFADGLKFDIEEAFDVSPYELAAIRQKPYSVEIRALLQWWGTELRRSQDENYWVDKGMEMVREAAGYSALVVVTDVRFVNEANAITEAGGLVCEITADESIRRERLGGRLPAAHASEVIDFDTHAIIVNEVEPELPPIVLAYLRRLL